GKRSGNRCGSFVATAATVHNIVMCKKIVDVMVDAVEAEESGAAGKGNTGRVTQGKPRAPKLGPQGLYMSK
ncbi:hypothetical protein C809_04252, partial [Lachnospiraceae bacterium MD335]